MDFKNGIIVLKESDNYVEPKGSGKELVIVELFSSQEEQLQ